MVLHIAAVDARLPPLQRQLLELRRRHHEHDGHRRVIFDWHGTVTLYSFNVPPALWRARFISSAASAPLRFFWLKLGADKI